MVAPLSLLSSAPSSSATAAAVSLSSLNFSSVATPTSLLLAILSKNAATTGLLKNKNQKKKFVTKIWARQQRHDLDSPWKTKLQSSQSPAPAHYSNKNILWILYRAWFHLPQIFRFFVGGNLGNIAFFYTEQFLFDYLSTNPYQLFSLEFLEYGLAGMSFGVAYLLQIVTTHFLFALLVYGLDSIRTPEKYLKTLWGQFRVYFVSLIGSTCLNSYLIHQLGVDKTVAFFGTMAVFACINYVLISWIVKRAVQSAEQHSNLVGANQNYNTKHIQGRLTNNHHHPQQKQKKKNKNNDKPNNKPSGGWFMNTFHQRGGGALFDCDQSSSP
jgi:hypothetical protein